MNARPWALAVILLLVSPWLRAEPIQFSLQGQRLSELCQQVSAQAGVSLVLPARLDQSGPELKLQITASLPELLLLLEQHFPVRFVQMPSGVLVQERAVTTRTVASRAPAVPRQPATDNLNAEPEQIHIQGQRVLAGQTRSGGWLDTDFRQQSVQWQERWQLSGAAQFSGLNLANSLQGLPGVSLTKDNGEGKQVGLWGLGADFVRVELDGMDALAVSGTSMDSRGQGSRSRAFDFNIFAAELFSEVVLKKSYRASEDEGGIAGTLQITPAKPFDFTESQARFSGQMGGNSDSSGQSPRLAALWSARNDRSGALLSLAYSERQSEESGYNTYKFRPLTAAGVDLSALDPALQQQIADKQLKFARGNRQSSWQSEQQRLGLTSSLQYQTAAGDLLQLDLLLARLRQQKNEYHLASRGVASTLISPAQLAGGQWQPASRVLALAADERGFIRYAEVADAVLTSESRQHQLDSDFSQWQLKTQHELGADTSMVLQLGHSQNQFKVPVNDKVYYESFADVVTDYQQPFAPQFSYRADLTDPAQWALHEADREQSAQQLSMDQARLRFSYQPDPAQSLSWGLAWKALRNQGQTYSRPDQLKNAWEQGSLDDRLLPGSYRLFQAYSQQEWLVANVPQVLADYQLQGNLTIADLLASSSFSLTEHNQAFWLDYQWQQERWQAALALRWVQNRTQSEAAQLSGGSQAQHWLPSAQWLWSLQDNLLWRTSLSVNLSRPALGNLSPAASVNTERQEISAGNAGLQAYQAQSLETALEWYPEQGALWSLAFFAKRLPHFVVTQSELMPYGATGLPLQLLGSGQTEQTLFWLRTPQNSDTAWLSGLELSAQQALSALPAPLNALQLQAYYNYNDGRARYPLRNGQSGTAALAGMSRHTAHLAVLYQGDAWGWRLSSSYRSAYLTSVTLYSEEEDVAGYLASRNWDFSAYIRLLPGLDLTLQLANLTGEKDRQFTDSSHQLYNLTRYGTSYYLGFSLTL
ncbi:MULTISPECIES: TonB-dependent receptor [Rheinheimera]|uniref:TonB-dependent receptor n=1 Tax=Rheinheimera marina TaxID=1774958 RepID=A0ABV9JPI8_9GAMM